MARAQGSERRGHRLLRDLPGRCAATVSAAPPGRHCLVGGSHGNSARERNLHHRRRGAPQPERSPRRQSGLRAWREALSARCVLGPLRRTHAHRAGRRGGKGASQAAARRRSRAAAAAGACSHQRRRRPGRHHPSRDARAPVGHSARAGSELSRRRLHPRRRSLRTPLGPVACVSRPPISRPATRSQRAETSSRSLARRPLETTRPP
jgi:hypothetical protein